MLDHGEEGSLAGGSGLFRGKSCSSVLWWPGWISKFTDGLCSVWIIKIALRAPAVAGLGSCFTGSSFPPCPAQDSQMHKKTLKRTRKFVVDGVEVSVTTSKIISEDEKKDEEMRFLRQVGHWGGGRAGFSSL